MSTTKGTPLTKVEVDLLINLVILNKIIISKATNATNNQLKEAAWLKITDEFNASISSCPRRTEQLKLKWENLKKAARKRSAAMRLSRNKTGGGKPDFFPPDDALDRVASVLGATCDGYTVPFGGDSVKVSSDSVVESQVTESDLVSSGDISTINGGDDNVQQIVEVETINEEIQAKKFFFSTPSRHNIVLKRKRKLEEEAQKARTSRNEAITNYYNEKTRKMKLETENLELQNKKLKFELENSASE